MGIKILSGGSSSPYPQSRQPNPPNPNPFRFSIKDSIDFGNHCVLIVHYPDCNTFEGKKVLVMSGNASRYLDAKELDPHFLENNNLIARFRPTEEGINQAVIFASSL